MSTTTRRPARATALPPEERRRAIIEATLPLVLANGRDVTTRQIADASGIAEGTVFRAFADKDELLDAVVEAALDPARLEARLAAVDPSLPWEARIVACVRAMQERSAGIWHLFSALGGPRPHTPRPPLQGLAPLVALLAEGPPLRYGPDAAALRLRALAIAGGHPALMGTHLLPPEEVVSLFLHGVLGPTPATRRKGTR